jgi:hypothetical protein
VASGVHADHRASYGRQLGRIIDVLSELIERWPGGLPDDRAVQRFAELNTRGWHRN